MDAGEISIPVGQNISVKGNLNIPPNAQALVIFSHGSGSSRFSTRNKLVAGELIKARMATLLTDLLTEAEDLVYENRFDIEKLTRRLMAVTDHVRHIPNLAGLPIGYFGASTGAASALRAAARLGDVIQAVVSRGGRPDLATQELHAVKAPTLLIVGSFDRDVLLLNNMAYEQLQSEKSLEVVNGASHLFEEPGKLEQVAQLAKGWFARYLNPVKQHLKHN